MSEESPEQPLFRRLEAIVLAAVQPGVTAAGTFLGGIVLPGLGGPIGGALTGTVFHYRKQRTERNLTRMVEHLVHVANDPSRRSNEAWRNLDENQKKIFQEQFFPVSADFVADEKELEKVPYLTEGLLSAMEGESAEASLFVEFNDILGRLRTIDLQILFDHSNFTLPTTIADWPKYSASRKTSGEDLHYIDEKLEKLGLLSSNREAEKDKAIEELTQAIQEIASRTGRISPGTRSQISLRYPRHFFESYAATDLGKKILIFSGSSRLCKKGII